VVSLIANSQPIALSRSLVWPENSCTQLALLWPHNAVSGSDWNVVLLPTSPFLDREANAEKFQDNFRIAHYTQSDREVTPGRYPMNRAEYGSVRMRLWASDQARNPLCNQFAVTRRA